MTSKTKKRASTQMLHIHLLRGLIVLGIALLAGTLALQALNAILPAEAPSQPPTLLGHPSASFRFNKENLFPFLLAPLILLIVLYLYLKRYLSRNSISAMDHIPYFRKHPHAVFGRKFYLVFSTVAIGLSAVLSMLCAVLNGVSEAWFGFVVVISATILTTESAKTLRHTRRQYYSHKRSDQGKGENI